MDFGEKKDINKRKQQILEGRVGDNNFSFPIQLINNLEFHLSVSIQTGGIKMLCCQV